MPSPSKRPGDEGYQEYLDKKKELEKVLRSPEENTPVERVTPSILEVEPTEGDKSNWNCLRCGKKNTQTVDLNDGAPVLVCDHCAAVITP